MLGVRLMCITKLKNLATPLKLIKMAQQAYFIS